MNYQSPSGFSQIPPVVKNLLIINGLFFLATWVVQSQFDENLTNWLGLFHWSSDFFKPYQWVTHFFMHGSFTHILFNMFALWMFGKILEQVWGPKRFLIYYLVTALGAAIIYTGYSTYSLNKLENEVNQIEMNPTPSSFNRFIQDNVPVQKWLHSENEELVNLAKQYILTAEKLSNNPEDPQQQRNAMDLAKLKHAISRNTPVIGASGAVFGILLAFGLLFPNTQLMLLFPPIPIKAKYFVMGYGALELYFGFQNNLGDSVAHFAHLGGMLFGYVLIKIWQKGRNTFY